MARFSQLTLFSSSGSYPNNVTFEVGILGEVVRFTQAGYNSGEGLQWYFSQQTSAEFGNIPAAENAAKLAAAVSGYLASIGESRYTVTSGHTTDFTGFPNSVYVHITAKAYDPGLDFNSAVVLNGDGTGTFATMRGAVPTQTVTATVTDTTCFGSSHGNIVLAVSGGVPPYQYLWNDGATSKDRYNLPAGNFSVRVTDSTAEDGLGNHPGVVHVPVTIGQNPEIQVVGAVGDSSITLDVSGGVAPYTFLWDDGPTTQNRTKITHGSYTVTVTDSIGCHKSFTFTISRERFYFSKNPVLLELQAAGVETKPNLTFLCEVWLETEYLSGNFEKVADLEHPADRNGSTRFDVAEYLHAYVKPWFPPFGQSSVARSESAFKRFYLKHTQKYGTPAEPEGFVVMEQRYVLFGGLSFEELSAGTYFSTYLQSRKPFFSWLPTTRKVREDQPEYLSFMPFALNTTAFQVRAKVRYTDGIEELRTLYVQNYVRRYELWSIPVGHNLLGSKIASAGKMVSGYDVWVLDQDGEVISEVRTYELDRSPRLACRYFMYANAVGGVNTLAATGLASRELAVQSETVERLPMPGYRAENGEEQVVGKTGEPVLKLSTGHMQPAEFETLQDFALSHEVRLVATDRYQAGQLQIRNMEVFDEDSQLYYLNFDFRLPTMRNYTPTIPLA